MQVSLAKTEGLERKLTVTVPAEQVESRYKNRLNEVAKTAKIDGFRPGKVPARVVEERYGPSVRHEIVDQLLRETLEEALKEKELNPAGPPTIDSLKSDPGADVEYEAKVEVFPEFELQAINGAEIEQVTAEVTDADVDDVLNKLREQHADWKEVERPAQNGDQLKIDFEGFIDGEAFEGGKAEQVPLTLGSNTMIPGFEDGLAGAKAGDELEVNVTFPEKYHAEDLAGKPAVFKVKVHQVNEPELPELNDDFAEKFSVKEGGIEALKTDIRKHMERELSNAVKANNKSAVFDKLKEANPIDIPEALIESEMKNLHQMSQQQQGVEAHDHELSEAEKEQLKEPAKDRVQLGLLINEVIKSKELSANQDKVKTLIQEMAGMYDNPEEFAQWYTEDRQRLAQVEAMALEEQVVDELLKDATVTTVEKNYKDVVGR